MATAVKVYPFEMEERFSAPGRLVSRRRRPRIAGSCQTKSCDAVPGKLRDSDATGTTSRNALSGSESAAQSGAKKLSRSERSERSQARSAASLDTGKHLATTDANQSVAQWLKDQERPFDVYRNKLRMRDVLLDSMYRLFQNKTEQGDEVRAERWWKAYIRLHNCQGEWIGYRAECCHTRPVAVPVGCNYRLCPLCAAHRAEMARKRVRAMFDKLTHPVLITLTIPNLQHISKADFTRFRQKVKTFIKQHPWLRGGVYSLETTYNRTSKTWHIHVHILADSETPLPTKAERITVAGRSMYLFTLRKLSLEFDWVRQWRTVGAKRKLRKNASTVSEARENSVFCTWMESTQACKTLRFNPTKRKYEKNTDLSALELARRERWNRENRRVVDLRPVTDREGAAFEVLKYITKGFAFSDLPEAVEEFMNAVHGARLIATFGSWYGVKLDGDANEHDWSQMQCECGRNEWKPMGIFFANDVAMDDQGRYYVTSKDEGRMRTFEKVSAVLGSPPLMMAEVVQIKPREIRSL
jgi:hypothetical protein